MRYINSLLLYLLLRAPILGMKVFKIRMALSRILLTNSAHVL